MGYRVVYGQADQPAVKEKKKGQDRLWLWMGFFALFLVLTVQFWPQGRETLKELLIPGEPAVTAAALENLAIDLQSGEAISAALEGFCREILKHGTMDPY